MHSNPICAQYLNSDSQIQCTVSPKSSSPLQFENPKAPEFVSVGSWRVSFPHDVRDHSCQFILPINPSGLQLSGPCFAVLGMDAPLCSAASWAHALVLQQHLPRHPYPTFILYPSVLPFSLSVSSYNFLFIFLTQICLTVSLNHFFFSFKPIFFTATACFRSPSSVAIQSTASSANTPVQMKPVLQALLPCLDSLPPQQLLFCFLSYMHPAVEVGSSCSAHGYCRETVLML